VSDEIPPDLVPPDVLARAAEVKAARPPIRLCYGEDLVRGMIILVDRPCGNPMAALLEPEAHRHGTEQRTILEVRSEGSIVSAIVMGEDGEQHSYATHRLATVPIIATVRPT
jgi:hypothetical protein